MDNASFVDIRSAIWNTHPDTQQWRPSDESQAWLNAQPPSLSGLIRPAPLNVTFFQLDKH